MPDLEEQNKMLLDTLYEVWKFLGDEYRCERAIALEGEYVSADVRPIWNKVCDALGDYDGPA